MPSTMRGLARPVPSASPEIGHHVRARRDVMGMAAGRAHRDGCGTGVRAAECHGLTDRSQRRWFEAGPPVVLEFDLFLVASPDPWRWVAHVKATSKLPSLARLTDAELIERIRELRVREKLAEGEDGSLDVQRGIGWLERAACKEVNASIDEELAAAFIECAARNLAESEVL